jgi:hypothetical protein
VGLIENRQRSLCALSFCVNHCCWPEHAGAVSSSANRDAPCLDFQDFGTSHGQWRYSPKNVPGYRITVVAGCSFILESGSLCSTRNGHPSGLLVTDCRIGDVVSRDFAMMACQDGGLFLDMDGWGPWFPMSPNARVSSAGTSFTFCLQTSFTLATIR